MTSIFLKNIKETLVIEKANNTLQVTGPAVHLFY